VNHERLFRRPRAIFCLGLRRRGAADSETTVPVRSRERMAASFRCVGRSATLRWRAPARGGIGIGELLRLPRTVAERAANAAAMPMPVAGQSQHDGIAQQAAAEVTLPPSGVELDRLRALTILLDRAAIGHHGNGAFDIRTDTRFLSSARPATTRSDSDRSSTDRAIQIETSSAGSSSTISGCRYSLRADSGRW